MTTNTDRGVIKNNDKDVDRDIDTNKINTQKKEAATHLCAKMTSSGLPETEHRNQQSGLTQHKQTCLR